MKYKKNNRTEYISCRVTPAEKKAMQKAAKRSGAKDFADWMRAKLLGGKK